MKLFEPYSVRKISEYRTELMGVATLLVILVHSYDSGVVMPNFIRTCCSLGSLGVDIFLLVSGFGLWYSLNRLKVGLGGVFNWYATRYKRIFVPYFFICFPLMIFEIYNGVSIGKSFLKFLTIDFWLNHNGTWYVAMLIPLYAITPLHYLICCRVKKPFYYNFFIIIVLVILVSLPVSKSVPVIDDLIANIRHVLYRLPVFFVGWLLAPLSKANEKLSFVWMVFIPLFVVVAMRFLNFGYWPGFLVLPLIYYLCMCFDMVGLSKLRVFSFYGKISLESYLLNDSIGPIIITLLPMVYYSPLNKGCYLYYILVIVLGTILANYIKKLSNSIIARINPRTVDNH